MSTQNIKVRKANKHVDYVLAALEKNLGEQLEEKEKVRQAIDKKQQEQQKSPAPADGEENE